MSSLVVCLVLSSIDRPIGAACVCVFACLSARVRAHMNRVVVVWWWLAGRTLAPISLSSELIIEGRLRLERRSIRTGGARFRHRPSPRQSRAACRAVSSCPSRRYHVIRFMFRERLGLNRVRINLSLTQRCHPVAYATHV